jgi:dTDP-4-dehydrorhamnose 3,5-epimerase
MAERLLTLDQCADPALAESGLCRLPIDGAFLFPLRAIAVPGGDVLHMLRTSFPLLPGLEAGEAGGEKLSLGELYFSEVLPGCVKAWKRHARQTQHFCVPSGQLGIALYDARPDSPTKGAVQALVLGRGEQACYGLLRIPCGVWYGFTALGDRPALICNAPDLPHDPAEGEKMPFDSNAERAFPFDWESPFPSPHVSRF